MFTRNVNERRNAILIAFSPVFWQNASKQEQENDGKRIVRENGKYSLRKKKKINVSNPISM